MSDGQIALIALGIVTAATFTAILAIGYLYAITGEHR